MRLSTTKKLTLSAMVLALCVLCLYAASAVPYMKITCLFLSSVFVYALLCEKLYLFGIVSYIACSLIGFLILPNKLYLVPYVLLLGHYSIFKVFIESRCENFILNSCFKLLYCNVFSAVGVAVALFVFKQDISAIVNVNIPKWLVIVVLELMFIAYDFVLSLCFHYYEKRLRRAISGRAL